MCVFDLFCQTVSCHLCLIIIKYFVLRWLSPHDSRGTRPRAVTHGFYKIKATFRCNDCMYIWRLFQMKNICLKKKKKETKREKKSVI